MKSRSLQFTISTAAAVLFCSFILFDSGATITPPADDHEKDKVLIKTLMSSLQNAHYAPINIDDDFSKKAFGLYLERLDYSKRFLLQEDVKALRAYETKIDDQVNESDFTLFDKSWDILQNRLKETQGYYREILAEPFDYKVIKSDVPHWVGVDASVQKVEMKLEYYGVMLYTLSDILKQIHQMSYNIKNMIEWRRFVNGS